MKLLLSLCIVLSTSLAHADYFGCKLTVGSNSRDVEADYRGRVAGIELPPFRCEGALQNNGTVLAVISSTETGDIKLASAPGQASVVLKVANNHGEGQDVGRCDCSLR